MEKLKMMTRDLTQSNIEKIAQLFPNVITKTRDENGELKQAIDFELLKQELSKEIVEGDKERYQLTWPGKRQAILLANQPIYKTLRPVKEDSVNWDTTENLYIEGDNLEVLKLLQESYLNKVKCIYIDPPYNTGKDFLYKDNFKQDINEYLEESGQRDENGNRLFQNTDANGRFHSDWLSMMYPRLKLARNLLSEDGVIFISIDDNEVHNLRKMCDELFGKGNFLTCIVWQKAFSPINTRKHFSPNHDFILCYAKNIDRININGISRDAVTDSRYSNPDNDPRGLWTSGDLSVGPVVSDKVYEIITPSGRKILPPEGRCWVLTKERFEEYLYDNRIWFGKDGNNVPRIKRFLSEVKKDITPMTIWSREDVGDNQESTRELKELFKDAIFNNPKPTRLLKQLIYIGSNKEDIILDFFSGSATTAHAVMQLNAEDGGNRKYIMVQLPEKCDKKSEAYKAGFKNICEIGKERIRRAAKKIKEETDADIDYGFRVFRVDSTNMKDVYYNPNQLRQEKLRLFVSNIKDDRTGEDLLIQEMLELGLELSLPMETKKMHGKKVHFVAGNSLVACFDENVPEELVRKLAQEKPLKVVFRDSSFKDDAARINVEEIFKMISPSTDVKVI